MGVAVRVFEPGLMHVLMGVLGPVVMGVGVLVLDVLVLVGGVRVGMRTFAVLVLVCMRRLVAVLFGHGDSTPFCLVTRWVMTRTVGDGA